MFLGPGGGDTCARNQSPQLCHLLGGHASWGRVPAVRIHRWLGQSVAVIASLGFRLFIYQAAATDGWTNRHRLHVKMLYSLRI